MTKKYWKSRYETKIKMTYKFVVCFETMYANTITCMCNKAENDTNNKV